MSKIRLSFIDFKLNVCILNALNDLGYKKPSPIQTKCIPYLLNGYDVLGIAQTGSGKTAAFSLPILNVLKTELNVPQALIIEPTRELVIQVIDDLKKFSKYMNNIKVTAIYGGKDYKRQLYALNKGTQIIVGTPGRLLDHISKGVLNLSKLVHLVLDEADEMLKMGFIKDIEKILSKLPKNHQSALFSATMPEKIRLITKRFMKNPKEIKIKSNIKNNPNITQKYCFINKINKIDALKKFIEVEEFKAVIIFVNTKNASINISKELEYNGYCSAPLNGDLDQNTREKTLNNMRNGKLNILVATDIAARGLDISHVELVINFDVPNDYKSYVHRIGRTGRAGRKGRSLTLIEKNEYYLLKKIQRCSSIVIKKISLPTKKVINEYRIKLLCKYIQNHTLDKDLNIYSKIIDKLLYVNKLDLEKLSILLLKIIQLNNNFFLKIKFNHF